MEKKTLKDEVREQPWKENTIWDTEEAPKIIDGMNKENYFYIIVHLENFPKSYKLQSDCSAFQYKLRQNVTPFYNRNVKEVNCNND